MNTTYELNNLRKDADLFDGKFTRTSPVVEVFSAMVNGQELSRFGAKANTAVNYIKDLGTRAENGDGMAVAELNTLRRFVIETPIMEEIKLLNIFGSYQHVGYDETIEREVYKHIGERSREQAAGGDVVFPQTVKETYPVATFTISGGYAVDYRRVALGDMEKEHEGLNLVKTDIRNRAVLAIVNRIYDANWFIEELKKHNPNYRNIEVISNYVGVSYKVKCRCKKCSYELETKASLLIDKRGGSGCPLCNQSKGEIIVYNYLLNNGIDFEQQKDFPNLLGVSGFPLLYDFYIPSKNLLIKVN